MQTEKTLSARIRTLDKASFNSFRDNLPYSSLVKTHTWLTVKGYTFRGSNSGIFIFASHLGGERLLKERMRLKAPFHTEAFICILCCVVVYLLDFQSRGCKLSHLLLWSFRLDFKAKSCLHMTYVLVGG